MSDSENSSRPGHGQCIDGQELAALTAGARPAAGSYLSPSQVVTGPPGSNTGGYEVAKGDNRRLLAYGLDTLYVHCRVDEVDLIRLRAEILGGQYGPYLSGQNGYEFELIPEIGFRVHVAPAANLDMGIYLLLGAQWLRSRPAHLWQTVIETHLANLGVDRYTLRISRADICLDLLHPDGLEVIERDQLVTRPRCEKAVYGQGESYTGFSVGKSDIRLRYYDKGLKARLDNELGYWQLHWGHELGEGETVGRVEWQIRGDFWRVNQIQSLEDLLERQGAIMAYLLDWARPAGPRHGHDKERDELPLWIVVRAAIESVHLAVVGHIVRSRLKLGNADRLIDQLVGLTASVCCVLGLGSDAPWTVSQLWAFLGEGYASDKYRHKLKERWELTNLAAARG